MPDDLHAQVCPILRRLAAFEIDAQDILAQHEAAPARRFKLEDSYAKLTDLSLAQDELFRESLRAIEHELYRASHVVAWAGFIDWFHERLFARKLPELVAARPKWSVASAEDLREYADYGVIEAGKVAGIYPNNIMKGLHGLLNKRNECAHPSGYFPDRSDCLGYTGELFKRIEQLEKKMP